MVFFLELARRTTLSPQNMIYETAPFRDASTFRALGTPLSITSAGATPTVSRFALYDNPAQPVSRWVRWRTVSQDTGVSWNITFRITMMAYAR
ncbi:MAG: hypothetical protein IPG50_13990 [Myxococcales bacterium]|nr:hypothetical protein [Myxococcales bacterium]